MPHTPRSRPSIDPSASTPDSQSATATDLAVARASALLTATGRLTWVVDATGRAVDDLLAWRAFTGLAAREARGEGWLRAVHPEDRAGLTAIWGAAPQGDGPHAVTLRIRQRDGEYRTLPTRIVPVAPEGERSREWVCSGDLTSTESEPITPKLASSNVARRGLLDALFSAAPENLALFDRDGALLKVNSAAHAAERSREIEAMFDTLADAALLYDDQGNLRRINQSALRMLGLEQNPNHFSQPLDERSRQFVVRDEHGQPLPPDGWPQRRILRGERLEGPSAMDTLIHTLDGREIRLSTTGAPLRDEQGHIVGAVIIARDVSERRALERRTRDALEALLAMAEVLVASPSTAPRAPADAASADDGPLDTLTRATAQRLVELACRVLGCARASISVIDPVRGASRPLAVTGLTPEQERIWRRAMAHTRPEDYLDEEQMAELLSGRPIVLEFSRARERGQPTYDSQRTLIVPMRVDGRVIGNITAGYGSQEHRFTPDEIALGEAVGHLCSLVVERERLLRDHAASEARAWALEVTKRRMDEFLGVVSHELRTPLTSIKANIQIARRRLHSALFQGEMAATEQTRALPDLLVRAERQVGRLDTLVNDLLDVSRIQSGKLRLRLAPSNLLDIVTEAVQDERLAWPGRDVALAGEQRTSWPVQADGDRIRQVVANYLTNALKYAPHDRPIVVNVAAEPGGATARVSIRDQGPGVPAGEREHIWELFHQVPSTKHLNGSGVGLGLGLHICKTIVERHGGQVGVESAEGQGSTFWFTLPLAEDESAAHA